MRTIHGPSGCVQYAFTLEELRHAIRGASSTAVSAALAHKSDSPEAFGAAVIAAETEYASNLVNTGDTSAILAG